MTNTLTNQSLELVAYMLMKLQLLIGPRATGSARNESVMLQRI